MDLFGDTTLTVARHGDLGGIRCQMADGKTGLPSAIH